MVVGRQVRLASGDSLFLTAVARVWTALMQGLFSFRKTWGYGGYDKELNEAAVEAAFRRSLELGVKLIDTAAIYGKGTQVTALAESEVRGVESLWIQEQTLGRLPELAF